MRKETLDGLLAGMLESGPGVSDLLFISGKPPLIERHGQLQPFPTDRDLDGVIIQQITDLILDGSERLQADLRNTGSCDCSYSLEPVARFRVNVFKQCGRHAIVMRKLQSEIPSLDALGMAPIFREIIKAKNGIVFVTGGTGSGKTTTLAAMLNELNVTQGIHILTLEDPIEFLHPHRMAAMSQRELGKDFFTFADGLRAALRQAPKVILVGEIRDRETMEIAMTAAETGHVVYSTLHTINAGQTINRILGMFGREEEQQLRQRLAETVRYVVSQRLVSKVGGGRLMVSEIMGSSLRTREVILYGENENRTFVDIIEAGGTMGWHSFDQSLLRAFEAGEISEEATLLYCSNKSRMLQRLDASKKIQGLSDVEAPSGLGLQTVTKAAPAAPVAVAVPRIAPVAAPVGLAPAPAR